MGEVCQTPSLPLSVGSFFSRQEILTCNIGFDGNFIAGDGEEVEKRIYGDRFLSSSSLQYTKETHDDFPFLLRPHPYFLFSPVLISLRSRARENEVSWPVDPIYRSNINH